jgi:hypothetical protein
MDCRRMLLALAMCNIIDQRDIEDWWNHPCNHVMVHLVECCNPTSTFLMQPMVCCILEEHCCDHLNISIPTPTHTIHYTPSGQPIVKECSQKVNATVLVISILCMISIMGIFLVTMVTRYVQGEARKILLDIIHI